MRLPRDVSGRRLAKLLERYDYGIVRQRGSHIRPERRGSDAAPLTIPDHDALRVGTLNAILTAVGDATGHDRDTIARDLFG